MNSNSQHRFGPCDEYAFDIVELADGALHPERAQAVRLHMLDCLPCRRWHHEMASVDATLTSGLPRPVLSPAFTDNLYSRLHALTAVEPQGRAMARQAAEAEYQQMKAATGKEWRWRAILNGVATASVVGGIVFTLQSYAPAIATSVDVGNASLMIQAISVGAGIAIAVWAAARARLMGSTSLPTLFA
jgi:hypothetical protein